MAWIKTFGPDEASGLLKRLYDSAMQRAGRVFQIIRIQSLHPRALRSSTQLYIELMQSPHNALSRAQREMIATAVSRENDCFY